MTDDRDHDRKVESFKRLLPYLPPRDYTARLNSEMGRYAGGPSSFNLPNGQQAIYVHGAGQWVIR